MLECLMIMLFPVASFILTIHHIVFGMTWSVDKSVVGLTEAVQIFSSYLMYELQWNDERGRTSKSGTRDEKVDKSGWVDVWKSFLKEDYTDLSRSVEYSATNRKQAASIAVPTSTDETHGAPIRQINHTFVSLAISIISEYGYCTVLYRARHSKVPKLLAPARSLLPHCRQDWAYHSRTWVHLAIAVFERVWVQFSPAKSKSG